MKKLYFIVFIVSLMSILSGCGGNKFNADFEWEVEPFEFVSQREEKISLESLKGEVWLASFIFTNCETVCPPMTFNMTEVQAELKNQNMEDYKIVAFSVDPTVDTPQVLSDYLKLYNAPDESKWHLLTGYHPSFISQFAKNSFKTAVQADPNSNQVTHGTSFFLVNKEGIVVKSYNGYKDVPVTDIANDIQLLIEK